jgi:hypothetical protein
MEVKGRLKNKVLDLSNLTKHIGERKNRLESYFKLKEVGSVYDSFIVDKNHDNGDEVHVITSTGFIMVFNLNTKRFITVLHARPMQLKRYYINMGETVPAFVSNMCKLNNELNIKLNLNNK